MADPGPKWIMLSIAEAYKRLAESAELRDPQQLIDNASFGPENWRVLYFQSLNRIVATWSIEEGCAAGNGARVPEPVKNRSAPFSIV